LATNRVIHEIQVTPLCSRNWNSYLYAIVTTRITPYSYSKLCLANNKRICSKFNHVCIIQGL